MADSGISDRLGKLRPATHSILTKMQTNIYPLLFAFSIEYLSVEYLNHKIIKSCGAICRIDNANVSNLILEPCSYVVTVAR